MIIGPLDDLSFDFLASSVHEIFYWKIIRLLDCLFIRFVAGIDWYFETRVIVLLISKKQNG